MANVQIFILLFALLVSTAITFQEEGKRDKRAFEICIFYKESGFRCTGCHERRLCLPFNIGFTKTCGDPYPYCNKGFCSKTKGPMCDDSSNNAEKTANATSTTSSSAPEAATACTSE